MVIITMENGKRIEIQMNRDSAPNTVNNFLHLALQGFYNGLLFHRVIPGFMIQGGCPEGSGMGGPGYHIKGEFSSNGHKNPLIHNRGVISMARSRHMDSAGSQFFLMHADSPHLDGQYAAFGQIVSGLEVLDEIASLQTGMDDRPLIDARIKTIEVVDEGEILEPAKA